MLRSRLLVAVMLLPLPVGAQTGHQVSTLRSDALGAVERREPVATEAALPGYPACTAGEDGVDRIVLLGPSGGPELWACRSLAWEAVASAGGGVTDHGALSGLADDDHLQYHTDARAAAWLATVAAGGDLTGMYPSPSIAPDSVALGTDTTGGYAGSATEGGPATTAVALAANGADCAAGQWAAGVDASGVAEGCTADDTGTDDQTATEVPYTPTTGTDWTDPDPTHAGGALDDLAGRLTVEEAKPDDDVPEAGDFGALALTGDVTSVGLATTVVSGAVGVTELGDDATCAANEVVARNAGDTAFECQAAAGGSSDFADITSGTNTTAAMVVGAGASLKVASTGTVDASGLDHDGDGALEVSWDAGGGGRLFLDPTDDGSFEWEIRSAAIFGPGAYTFYRGFEPVITVGNTFDVAKNMHVGLQQINTPASQTCADEGTGAAGFLAVTVSGRAFVKLTNADANGCTVSVSETGATDGQRLELVVVSTAGGTMDFSDVAGLTELAGPFSAGQWDALTLRYTGDRWIEISRSDN